MGDTTGRDTAVSLPLTRWSSRATNASRHASTLASASVPELSAPRGDDCGNARKALRKFCTAAVESPEDGSVLARVVAALATGGSSGLAAAMRIAADAAPRVGRELFFAAAIYAPPPPEMMFECEIRFHKPGVGGYTDWRSIKDFYSVYAALKVHHRWGREPAWVRESSLTCRAFEASGRQILPGMRLNEFTAPSSICTVFDKEECEGVKYNTYTIFCGSDYQLRVRGRAPVDKCVCLVEAVKEYMASRAGA